MAPRKAAGTTKKATGRTTAAGSRIPSFDAERKKIVEERKATKPKQWRAYGRVWTVKPPNLLLATQVIGGGDEDEEQTVGGFTAYILNHVVKDERKDFTGALIADEDLDIDVLIAMVQSLNSVVYSD